MGKGSGYRGLTMGLGSDIYTREVLCLTPKSSVGFGLG